MSKLKIIIISYVQQCLLDKNNVAQTISVKFTLKLFFLISEKFQLIKTLMA